METVHFGAYGQRIVRVPILVRPQTESNSRLPLSLSQLLDPNLPVKNWHLRQPVTKQPPTTEEQVPLPFVAQNQGGQIQSVREQKQRHLKAFQLV